ncbi:MAG: hypothetical protein ACD_46C00568G0002 [uncultured bacterium]|nr:MAG: hypothetical protein ACD_46C00568G0002 [uncultured bacterium]
MQTNPNDSTSDLHLFLQNIINELRKYSKNSSPVTDKNVSEMAMLIYDFAGQAVEIDSKDNIVALHDVGKTSLKNALDVDTESLESFKKLIHGIRSIAKKINNNTFSDAVNKLCENTKKSAELLRKEDQRKAEVYNKQNQTIIINFLPKDIIHEILSHLDVRSRNRFLFTSTKARDIVYDDSFWIKVLKKDFKVDYPQEKKLKETEKSARERYIELWRASLEHSFSYIRLTGDMSVSFSDIVADKSIDNLPKLMFGKYDTSTHKTFNEASRSLMSKTIRGPAFFVEIDLSTAEVNKLIQEKKYEEVMKHIIRVYPYNIPNLEDPRIMNVNYKNGDFEITYPFDKSSVTMKK